MECHPCDSGVHPSTVATLPGSTSDSVGRCILSLELQFSTFGRFLVQISRPGIIMQLIFATWGHRAQDDHHHALIKHYHADIHFHAEIKHNHAEIKHHCAEVKHYYAEIKHYHAEIKHHHEEIKHYHAK